MSENNSEHKHNNDKEFGPKDIADILDAVADKVPGMIKGIFSAIYSAESGTEAGKSVGNFYTNLLESGIPEDLALKLTERYMFSVRDVVQAAKSADKDED
jgi:phage tail protein X